jgi:hypothetical protein
MSSPNKPAATSSPAALAASAADPKKSEVEADNSDPEDQDEGSDDEDITAALNSMTLGPKPSTTPPLALDSIDLAGVCAAIKKGTIKKVLVMTGAGVSVSAIFLS